MGRCRGTMITAAYSVGISSLSSENDAGEPAESSTLIPEGVSNMITRFSPGKGSSARTTILAIIAVLCSLAAGCSKPLTGQPQEAAPGATIFLQKENAGFKNVSDIGVMIDGRPAPVVRIVDESTVEVMVPKLPPGIAEVQLTHRGRSVGVFETTISPAPLRRLYMTLDGDDFRIDRVRPYNGHYDRPETRGRRLSYDVVDENDRLIHTGAIRFPTDQTVEVFGYPNSTSIRREKVRGPNRFILKIPYAEGPVRVRLYRVEDGVDLADARERKSRVFIREFELTSESSK